MLWSSRSGVGVCSYVSTSQRRRLCVQLAAYMLAAFKQNADVEVDVPFLSPVTTAAQLESFLSAGGSYEHAPQLAMFIVDMLDANMDDKVQQSEVHTLSASLCATRVMISLWY